MSSKPKVTFYWCASCGGCEETVVDLAEGILDVVAAVDIVLWPVALDFKYKDVEAMDDGSIAVSFINGAIRTAEQEHVAKLLRKKSQLVIAFGACSSSGGIPALANLTSRKKIFDRSYHNSPTVENKEGIEPKTKSVVDGHELTLPEFYETVYKLSDVVDVDYFLPGCPPTPGLLSNAVTAILEGKLPEKGSVLAPDVSLCKSCTRNESKPEDIEIDKIERVIDKQMDPEKCFLTQGVICMGPATRDGCEQLCINGNMPCTGCFGPTSQCLDQGAKMISMLGGIVAGDNKESIQGALNGLPDAAGTFYKYTMASSFLGSSNRKDDKKEDK